MQSLFEPFANKRVRIEQTGDKPISGRLVNIQTDYATVWDGSKLTHCPYAHIKSVSSDITEHPEAGPVPNVELTGTFIELLKTLIKQMVRIENGDGSREGVLSDITEESISLIVGTKELTVYPFGQIKNISPKFTIAATGDTQGPNNSDEGSSSSKNARKDKDASDEAHDTETSDASSNETSESGQKTILTVDNSTQSTDAWRQPMNDSHSFADESRQQNPKIFNMTRAMNMMERLNEMYNQKQVRYHKSTVSKKSNDSSAVGITTMLPTEFGKRRRRPSKSR